MNAGHEAGEAGAEDRDVEGLMDRRARLHRHVRIGLVAAGEVVLRLDVLVLPFATNALVALATIAFTQRRNIDGIGRRRLCRFALHSFPLDIALSAAECRPVVCRVCLSGFAFRSEEHTSELQSLMRISYAVF